MSFLSTSSYHIGLRFRRRQQRRGDRDDAARQECHVD